MQLTVSNNGGQQTIPRNLQEHGKDKGVAVDISSIVDLQWARQSNKSAKQWC
ncbi:MAG TPA: hypothetical protein VIW67_26600 [Terriglobales bacterium]|jgi:hypothetical protein